MSEETALSTEPQSLSTEREREREREDLFGRQFVLSDETSPVGVGHKWTNEIGLID